MIRTEDECVRIKTNIDIYWLLLTIYVDNGKIPKLNWIMLLAKEPNEQDLIHTHLIDKSTMLIIREGRLPEAQTVICQILTHHRTNWPRLRYTLTGLAVSLLFFCWAQERQNILSHSNFFNISPDHRARLTETIGNYLTLAKELPGDWYPQQALILLGKLLLCLGDEDNAIQIFLLETSTCNGCNTNFEIHRTLSRHICIKCDNKDLCNQCLKHYQKDQFEGLDWRSNCLHHRYFHINPCQHGVNLLRLRKSLLVRYPPSITPEPSASLEASV